MEEFQKFYEIANMVNLTEFVKRIENLISTIRTQNFTKIAVTGVRNVGKTTFINKIVGTEVWEAGNMDEDEKPLRISFEPLNDDENFNCILKVEQNWHDLKAIIYELREQNLIKENSLSEEMYPLDVVFFIISATAPFTKSEIDFLKALSLLQRQVIVNGMFYVKESDREKVKNYISKINNSLNLPPVIFIEDDEKQNLGKIIRNILPSYIELNELRENKCKSVMEHTLNVLEQAVRKAIQDTENESSESARSFAIKTDGLRSNCYTLRMDVEDYKKNAVGRIVKDLSDDREKLFEELVEAANKNRNADKIQEGFEKKYKLLSISAVETLQRIFMEDLRKIDSSAGLIGVPNWCEDTAKQLEKFSPENILKNLEPKKLNATSSNSKDINKTALIGTGILAGGMLLAPLPAAISIGGAVIAAAYGAFSYMKDKKRGNREDFNVLHDFISKGLENIDSWIRKIADISYSKITEQILIGEKSLSNLNTAQNESKISELNDLLKVCNQIRENLNNG